MVLFLYHRLRKNPMQHRGQTTLFGAQQARCCGFLALIIRIAFSFLCFCSLVFFISVPVMSTQASLVPPVPADPGPSTNISQNCQPCPRFCLHGGNTSNPCCYIYRSGSSSLYGALNEQNSIPPPPTKMARYSTNHNFYEDIPMSKYNKNKLTRLEKS